MPGALGGEDEPRCAGDGHEPAGGEDVISAPPGSGECGFEQVEPGAERDDAEQEPP